ncbi:MAG: NAD-dependent epimerase/dehydratase family protein [Opitutales bacterium]
MPRAKIDSRGNHLDSLEMEPGIVILGCGYLGQELARQALSKGFRVTALTRNGETAECLRREGAHLVVEADLDDDVWHGQINPEQDFVINCVGAAGGGMTGYVKSYLNGQNSVLRWLDKGRIGTFVFTSSVSVYPQTDGSMVSEESSHEGVSERGALLLEAERVVFPGPDSIDRSFVLRLGGIYGPSRHLFLDRLRLGDRELPGCAEFFLNLIHRDDACSAVWAALEAPADMLGCVYNVSDGYPVTRGDLVSWLAARTGSAPVEFSGQSSSRHRSAAESVMPNRRVDNALIVQELDWHPRYPSFREGYDSMLVESQLPS